MKLTRRTLLRGAGAAIALPWLEAMAPVARAAEAVPKRFVVFFVPNGMWMPDFTPATTGRGYTHPHLLEPLAPWADDTLVLTGLSSQVGLGEPHAAATGALLTGIQVSSEQGASTAAGISIDQVIANAVGGQTRFPSLQLGSEGDFVCDVAGEGGFEAFCAYMWNISWADGSTPLAKQIRPAAVFERLFGDIGVTESAAARTRRIAYDRSVLDSVTADARSISARVGKADRDRLDAYLTGIRELERRLDFDPPTGVGCVASAQAWLDQHGLSEPEGAQEHVQQMTELMTLAMQCDASRVITYMLGTGRSDRPYPFLGVPEAHHYISHHAGDQDKIDKLRVIYRWEMERYAALLAALAAVPEADGTRLLDHTMVLLCSGISDSDSHVTADLPVVVGGGRAMLNTGQHLRFDGQPVANLHMSLAAAMDVSLSSFGTEGTGALAGVVR